MKNYLILFFIIFIKVNGFTQISIGERFAIGGSLTYIPNTQVGTLFEDWVHEWTLNTNISTSITKRFSLGISGMFVRTYKWGEQNNYNLFGGFLQFDFIRNDQGRLYGESGLFLGNYCTCGRFDPYNEPNLKYLNFGGGYEWQLHPQLSLEVGLIIYRILDKIEFKYGYTQYVIGLNYTIFREKNIVSN